MSKKYDWATVMRNIRKTYMKKVSKSFPQYDRLDLLINETDNLHPLDTEDELDKALKEGDMEEIIYALGSVMDNITENVVNYFANTWNFEPGYKRPSQYNLPEAEDFTKKELKSILE